MSTAIALVCRFYGFNDSEVNAMTQDEFMEKFDEISVIMNMESGGSGSSKSNSIEMTPEKAMRMFGKKKK